ncbi:MAG: sigma 54-interacting transcriptional regulator [Lentisphaerae bacterium]|jgi:PAS domain S-box-containing protein|nr:sigma 54-interacting transcriptional regulator [Lentisphaerota bacterium]
MNNNSNTPAIDAGHLAAVLDSISEGVFAVNTDKQITFFNRAAEEITGFTAAEAIGQPCQDIFRSDACGSRCILDHVRKTGQNVNDQRVSIIDRDGHSRTLCVSASALRDPAGHYLGGIETFRDVSIEEDLRRRLEHSYTFQDIVSRHPDMHKIFAILPDIAESQVPVLIEGESGTGKELFARAIHNLSNHHQGRFVALNCGALPDMLLEAELFGYRKGAFTDAKTDKPGRFDIARGGTLFLDEIGNVSAAMQMRLLRVLQEKTYEPLGSVETLHSDARIIAAANQSLTDLIANGSFRQDLYYRLNVMCIRLPPLRERRSDIPLLVEYFRQRLNAETGKNITAVAPKVYDSLMSYDYPGNIRELENIMQHAFVLCRTDTIQCSHLPPHICSDSPISNDTPAPLTLKALEKRAIIEALEANADNRTTTARQLGIDPSSLYRKMRRYNID